MHDTFNERQVARAAARGSGGTKRNVWGLECYSPRYYKSPDHVITATTDKLS